MIYRSIKEEEAPFKIILNAVKKGRNREECLKIFAAQLSNFYSKFGFTADITRMRHSASFAKAVFGLDINPFLDPDLKGQGAWDNSTPVLMAAMLKYIDPTSTVLAIGSGPFATEACVLSIEKNMPVTVLEIHKPYIASSKITAKANKANVRFIHSDIYHPFSDSDKLPEKPDYITWNPPYVPSAAVKEKVLFGRPADGGPTGRELIVRALRELPERYRQAKLIFAVNTRWQNEEMMIKTAEENGFSVLEIFSLPGSASKAFIMQHAFMN